MISFVKGLPPSLPLLKRRPSSPSSGGVLTALPDRLRRAAVTACPAVNAFRVPHRISNRDGFHHRYLHRADPVANATAHTNIAGRTYSHPAESGRNLHDQRYRAEDFAEGAAILEMERQRDCQQIIDCIAGKHPHHFMLAKVLVPHIKSRNKYQCQWQQD